MNFYQTNSEILNNLLQGVDLDDFNARNLMKRWLNEEIKEVQTGAFLAAFGAGAGFCSSTTTAGAFAASAAATLALFLILLTLGLAIMCVPPYESL